MKSIELRGAGVLEPMTGGDFQPVRTWLQEHCCQHGRRYSSGQILRRATGRQLNQYASLSFLREKYREEKAQ